MLQTHKSVIPSRGMLNALQGRNFYKATGMLKKGCAKQIGHAIPLHSAKHCSAAKTVISNIWIIADCLSWADSVRMQWQFSATDVRQQISVVIAPGYSAFLQNINPKTMVFSGISCLKTKPEKNWYQMWRLQIFWWVPLIFSLLIRQQVTDSWSIKQKSWQTKKMKRKVKEKLSRPSHTQRIIHRN